MDWAQAETEYLEGCRAGRALAAAIGLWARSRHAALRALTGPGEVDWPTPDLPPAGEAALQAWMTAAGKVGAPLPGALVAQLPLVVKRATPKVAKLTLAFLAQQPPDPRVGAALTAIADAEPELLLSADGANAFARALLQHADTGHRALVLRVRSTVALKLRGACRDCLASLEAAEPPPEGWVARLLGRATELGPAVRSGSRSEPELWSLVYEQPADLQARAVLADLLIDRGDPRGPFIAEQLAGSQTAPAPEVERLLLGPIARALIPESLEFVAGFPVRGQLDGRLPARELSVALLHREWATFEQLDHLDRLAPTLRSLRTAWDLSRKGVEAWIKQKWPIPLTQVGLPFDALERVLALPVAPREVRLNHPYLHEGFELEVLFESLAGARELRVLRFGWAMLWLEEQRHWTSELGAAWPSWSPRALDVPALEEVWWRGRGFFETGRVTTRSRFDTLAVELGERFEPGALARVLHEAALVRGDATHLRVTGPFAHQVEAALTAASR